MHATLCPGSGSVDGRRSSGPAKGLSCLALIAVILSSVCLSGCSDECEQDYGPPTEITTSENPYASGTLSSDLGIAGTWWQNVTSGESGTGSIEQVYECVFPIGCGTWTRMTNSIPLVPGLNTVYIYETSDGCNWREDYLITLE